MNCASTIRRARSLRSARVNWRRRRASRRSICAFSLLHDLFDRSCLDRRDADAGREHEAQEFFQPARARPCARLRRRHPRAPSDWLSWRHRSSISSALIASGVTAWPNSNALPLSNGWSARMRRHRLCSVPIGARSSSVCARRRRFRSACARAAHEAAVGAVAPARVQPARDRRRRRRRRWRRRQSPLRLRAGPRRCARARARAIPAPRRR